MKRVHQQRSLLTAGENGYQLLTSFAVLSKANRNNTQDWNFAFNHHMLICRPLLHLASRLNSGLVTNGCDTVETADMSKLTRHETVLDMYELTFVYSHNFGVYHSFKHMS